MIEQVFNPNRIQTFDGISFCLIIFQCFLSEYFTQTNNYLTRYTRCMCVCRHQCRYQKKKRKRKVVSYLFRNVVFRNAKESAFSRRTTSMNVHSLIENLLFRTSFERRKKPFKCSKRKRESKKQKSHLHCDALNLHYVMNFDLLTISHLFRSS